MIKYTKEEHEFMKVYVYGHSYEQIQETFKEKFGHDITIQQIKSYICNHHLTTGKDGKFKKGNVPHNKGKKGVYAKGCEKSWFKEGNIPMQHRPVGSERITRDGYIEIKVAEPNKWDLKHRVVYENLYGKIPDGHVLIFRDGNKENVAIDNLILVTRGVNAVINREGISACKNEMKDTAVIFAKLKSAVSKKEKMLKRGE